jgi:hypothetical protein
MAEITINFKYDIPDTKWGTTNLNKRQSNWTYTGPENLYVPVDKNGKFVPSGIVDADANPGYKYQPMYTTVLVNVKEVPLIGALLNPDPYGINWRPTVPITLPDGRVHQDHEDPLLTHVYSATDIVYNFNTKSWTFPFATSAETWDSIRQKRDGLLTGSDQRVNDDAPVVVQEMWKAYRQELRDITTTWANSHPAEVIFPPTPQYVPPALV